MRVTVTTTLVPNQHVSAMLTDGWDNKGEWNQSHTIMRKAGKHITVNGVSERVWNKLERDMIKRYRFQLVKG